MNTKYPAPSFLFAPTGARKATRHLALYPNTFPQPVYAGGSPNGVWLKDSAGLYVNNATDIPPMEYVNGRWMYLPEPAGTNEIGAKGWQTWGWDDTTGWVVANDSTITSTSTQALIGTSSALCSVTTNTGSRLVTPTGTSGMVGVEGDIIDVNIGVKRVSGGTSLRFKIREFDSGGTQTRETINQEITITDSWDYYSLRDTLGASTAFYSIEVRSAGEAVEFYMDGAMVEKNVPVSSISFFENTRTASNLSLTGASAYIGQTEGAIYTEVNISKLGFLSGGGFRRILGLSDGTNSNRIAIWFQDDNKIMVRVTESGSTQREIVSSALTVGFYRIYIEYGANLQMWINGSSIGSGSVAAVPACSNIYIGKQETSSTAQEFTDGIGNTVIWPEIPIIDQEEITNNGLKIK